MCHMVLRQQLLSVPKKFRNFSLSRRTLTVLFHIVIIIVGDYNSFSEYDLEENYGDFETKNFTF